LHELAVKWVLSNPDMQTVLMSFHDFDTIDRFLSLSGSQIARSDELVLDDYRTAYSDRYCRHGCNECVGACPHSLPVSTIMRYAYYFTEQGREKHAMTKYTKLHGRDGSVCVGCGSPCTEACPFGVNIPANLMMAHHLLTLA
jgi:predicted aldo/keto reductase-like oxidoreductase